MLNFKQSLALSLVVIGAAQAGGSGDEPKSWNDLPRNLQAKVLAHTDLQTIGRFACTSRRGRELANHPTLHRIGIEERNKRIHIEFSRAVSEAEAMCDDEYVREHNHDFFLQGDRFRRGMEEHRSIREVLGKLRAVLDCPSVKALVFGNSEGAVLAQAASAPAPSSSKEGRETLLEKQINKINTSIHSAFKDGLQWSLLFTVERKRGCNARLGNERVPRYIGSFSPLHFKILRTLVRTRIGSLPYLRARLLNAMAMLNICNLNRLAIHRHGTFMSEDGEQSSVDSRGKSILYPLGVDEVVRAPNLLFAQVKAIPGDHLSAHELDNADLILDKYKSYPSLESVALAAAAPVYDEDSSDEDSGKGEQA